MEGLAGIKFGVEIEFFGMPRSEAAAIVASVLGGKAVKAGSDFKIRANDGTWQVMYDGSIKIGGREVRYVEGAGQACELVTPPITLESLPRLVACIEALKESGARVNETCGTHVHVDMTTATGAQLSNFVSNFLQVESEAFDTIAGRKANAYCKAFPKALARRIAENTVNGESAQSVFDAIRAHNESLGCFEVGYRDKTTPAYNRYYALNLVSWLSIGTVELRMFAGSLDTALLVDRITFALSLRKIAMSKPVPVVGLEFSEVAALAA